MVLISILVLLLKPEIENKKFSFLSQSRRVKYSLFFVSKHEMKERNSCSRLESWNRLLVTPCCGPWFCRKGQLFWEWGWSWLQHMKKYELYSCHCTSHEMVQLNCEEINKVPSTWNLVLVLLAKNSRRYMQRIPLKGKLYTFFTERIALDWAFWLGLGNLSNKIKNIYQQWFWVLGSWFGALGEWNHI